MMSVNLSTILFKFRNLTHMRFHNEHFLCPGFFGPYIWLEEDITLLPSAVTSIVFSSTLGPSFTVATLSRLTT